MDSAENGRISELRIILLGSRYSGKSSTGNTILCRQVFGAETEETVRGEAEVFGRRVTVVDIPAWRGRYFPLDSLKSVKQRLAFNVSTCSPGPHVFLMVIPVDLLGGKVWVVEEQLEFPIDSIWHHSIVLFTGGDGLGDANIERFLGREMRQLVEKCKSRYHVFNNKSWDDGTQVKELLEKVEEVVFANSGRCFEINEKVSKEFEHKTMEIEKRATDRLRKVQRRRETLRGLILGAATRLTELRILLLGGKYAGKSSTGNTILGREEFGSETKACQTGCTVVAELQVTVVDTLGWDWRSVEDTSERVKKEVARSVNLCPPEPHALLLVIPGDVTLTESDRRAVEEHMGLLGLRAWERTLVLFTMGDRFREVTPEQHIESWGAVRWLVEKCGNRYHVIDNENRADRQQVTELLDKVEEMIVGYDTENLLNMYQQAERSNRGLKEICEDQQRTIEKMRQAIQKRDAKIKEMVDSYMGEIEEIKQMCKERAK